VPWVITTCVLYVLLGWAVFSLYMRSLYEIRWLWAELLFVILCGPLVWAGLVLKLLQSVKKRPE
jgi:hypothetical protein